MPHDPSCGRCCLTKKEFAFLVASGNGRAVRHVRETGDAGLEESIVKALRSDQRYDRQTNEHHYWYLVELMTATGKPEWYLDHVLRAAGENLHVSNRNQVLGVLAELARRGHDRARRFIEENWQADLKRTDKYGRKTTCAEHFVQLGGFKAYRRVLQWLQSHTRKRGEVDHSLWCLHYIADESRWKRKAAWLRTRVAASNPSFAKFAGFPEIDPPIPPKKESTLSLEDRIRAGELAVLRRPSEKLRAVKMLDETLDDKAMNRLLRILDGAEVAVNVERVQRFIDAYDPAKEFESQWASPELRLVRRAVKLLRHSTDPAVRPLALEFLDRDDLATEGIELLQSCFRPGDEQAVVRLLANARNGEEFHSVAMSARQLVEAKPLGTWKEALRLMFERQPCTLCRQGLVVLMIRRRLLTVEDATDLAFDADPQTRRIVRKWLRRREYGDFSQQAD